MGIIFLMLSPLLVFAQNQNTDPVSYEITDMPDEVQAGEAFEVTVKASIEGDWHLYSINNDPDAGPYPTQFSSANSSLFIIDDVKESEADIEFDPNFDTELGWHSSEATFTIPLAFQTDVSGSADIDLEALFQVCDDAVCLPPTTKSITASIEVEGVADNPVEGIDEMESDSEEETAAAAPPSDSTEEAEQTEAEGVGSDGFLAFLWIALTAGFAALLTPCVFPMIPLTVSFFSKDGTNKGRTKTILQAFSFGLAIIITFTVLGALLAVFIGASGANQFAANPWINLFIAAVLIIFAVSLLGAFELRLPYQLTNWLNQKSDEKSGLLGILFMALTISAVSFSCTAPFVGGVLAATAGGDWFYPIIGMAGFSAAFASPFVIFALFPSWLESLPQSGSWMNIVKVLLGFIELAAAVKFLSNADLVWNWGIVSRPFAIAIWIAIFFVAGLYVLGVFSLHEEKKQNRLSTGRLFLALPMFIFSFYLVPGLLGANLGIWDAWLPPKQSSDVSVVRTISSVSGGATDQQEQENWSKNYASSLEKAKKEQKPIFIDFTGYTCTNCRDMEANVFPLASIQEEFEQMEKVRLYTDDGNEGPANQKTQLEMTGTVALPTYAIVNPENEEVLEQWVGMADEKEFKEFLQKGIDKY